MKTDTIFTPFSKIFPAFYLKF